MENNPKPSVDSFLFNDKNELSPSSLIKLNLYLTRLTAMLSPIK